jgi:hypothetical protein
MPTLPLYVPNWTGSAPMPLKPSESPKILHPEKDWAACKKEIDRVAFDFDDD